jgi:hypothetical protein
LLGVASSKETIVMNIRNVLIGLVASAILIGVVSCGGGSSGGSSTPPAAAAPVFRSSALDGTQAGFPLVTGTGRGAVAVVSVNPATMEITGGISFAGLTGAPLPNPGGAHIHQTSDNGIVINLIVNPDNATATIAPGTVLSDDLYNKLVTGQLYFNVHTAAHGGGEIRGAITGTTGFITGLATLNGAQQFPASGSVATGRGTLVVDSVTREILTGYVTHNVAAADGAHIHTGAPGVNTPVTSTLDLNLSSTTSATAAQGATLPNLTDLNAGNLFFTVTNPTYPSGDIRGQIAVQ